jgi:hypothetical protein
MSSAPCNRSGWVNARRRTLLLSAFFLLLLCAPSAETALAAPSGSITDAVTHEPIAGVPVCAFRDRPFETEESSCAKSDSAGEYSLTALDPNEYEVEFKPGPAGLNYLYQAWNGHSSWPQADPVTVGTGETPDIDAELIKGGEIGGRVIDAQAGAPMPGVTVCAEPNDIDLEQGCAVTDAAGEYRIVGLGTAEYHVSFHAPDPEFLDQYWNGKPIFFQADPVAVVAGQLTAGINGVLIQGARIGGTVTDANTHLPVGEVLVCAFEASGEEEIAGCASTDAGGTYTIKGLASGVYYVSFFPLLEQHYSERSYSGNPCSWDAAPVAAVAGRLTAGIDVGLAATEPLCLPPPPPSGPRRGMVAEKATSLPNGRVRIKLSLPYGGELTFRATAKVPQRLHGSAKKTVVVAAKTVDAKGAGAGSKLYELAPNNPGRKLAKKWGTLHAKLTIVLGPDDEEPQTATIPIAFKRKVPDRNAPGERDSNVRQEGGTKTSR